jgi:hypothetical protein
MAKSSIFAIQASGLQAFLFADVAIEPNGSPLSVLSMMARSGEDPWARAAHLAAEPRSVAMEALAADLTATPSVDLSPADAQLTALRLVLLLPGHAAPDVPDALVSPEAVHRWVWLMVAVFCLFIILMGVLLPRFPAASVTTKADTGIAGTR